MSLKSFFDGACGNCKRNGNTSGIRGCSLNKAYQADQKLVQKVEEEKEKLAKATEMRRGRVSKPP
jgi:hypothetical protein